MDLLQSEKRLDADDPNTQRFQALVGRGDRAVEVNAAASLFDHESFKAHLARILRRVTDAEIESQTDKE